MEFHFAPNLIFKALAFALATLPMVIYNLRTGMITNLYNAVILLAGIGVLALGPTFGMSGFSLHSLGFWTLSAIVFLFFYKRGWIHGGATKFFIALLPWFSQNEYISVASCGLLVAAVIGLTLRHKEPQIAPSVVVCGLIALVVSAAH